jgi:hypothetical protein
MVGIEYDAKAQQLKSNMDKAGQMVKNAARAASQTAAETIVTRGRADIGAAGRFGSNWTNALNSQVSEEGDKINIVTTMTGGPPVSFWKVFEFGATISAKNASGLMWIPFDRENKTWPRDYPGPLFRIGRALFDSETKRPMYLGTPSVHIPQKFHLRDIIKQVAKELNAFYAANMR